jgi:hypothetical protein
MLCATRKLIGINYKDAPDNARHFLGRYGKPFGIIGVDGNGRAEGASEAPLAATARAPRRSYSAARI